MALVNRGILFLIMTDSIYCDQVGLGLAQRTIMAAYSPQKENTVLPVIIVLVIIALIFSEHYINWSIETGIA